MLNEVKKANSDLRISPDVEPHTSYLGRVEAIIVAHPGFGRAELLKQVLSQDQ